MVDLLQLQLHRWRVLASDFGRNLAPYSERLLAGLPTHQHEDAVGVTVDDLVWRATSRHRAAWGKTHVRVGVHPTKRVPGTCGRSTSRLNQACTGNMRAQHQQTQPSVYREHAGAAPADSIKRVPGTCGRSTSRYAGFWEKCNESRWYFRAEALVSWRGSHVHAQ